MRSDPQTTGMEKDSAFVPIAKATGRAEKTTWVHIYTWIIFSGTTVPVRKKLVNMHDPHALLHRGSVHPIYIPPVLFGYNMISLFNFYSKPS